MVSLVCSGYIALFDKEEFGCGFSVEVRARSFVRSGSLSFSGYTLAVRIEFSDFSCELNRVLGDYFNVRRVYDAEFYFYPFMSVGSSVVSFSGGVDVGESFYVGGGYHFNGDGLSGGLKLVTQWKVDDNSFLSFRDSLRRLDALNAFRAVERIIAETIPINWDEFWRRAKCHKMGKKRLNIVMDVEVIEELKKISAEVGRTISEMLEEKAREIIREHYGSRE